MIVQASSETAVLGAILVNPDMLPAVIETGLRMEHFATPQARAVYAEMLAIHADGKPVDDVLLMERLADSPTFQNDEYKFIGEAVGAVPTSTNAVFYAEQVLEAAAKREADTARLEIERMARHGTDLGEIAEYAASRRETNGAKQPFTVPLDSWREIAEEPIQWLFHETIPIGQTTILSSVSGLGKSRLLWAAIESGLLNRVIVPFFKPSKAMKILYLAPEDPVNIVLRGFAAIEREYGIPPSELDAAIKERLFIRCESSGGFLMFDRDKNVSRTPYFFELLAFVRKHRFDMIVPDTARRHFGLPDENSNAYSSMWIQCCDDLAKAAGGAVLATHHSAKGGDATTQESAAGGAGFVANAKAHYTLGLENGQLRLNNPKLSWAKRHEPVDLEIRNGVIFQVSVNRDPAELVNFISGWLNAHPEARIEQKSLHSKTGKAQPLFYDVQRVYPWAGREQVIETVRIGVEDGRLEFREMLGTGSDRHKYTALAAGVKCFTADFTNTVEKSRDVCGEKRVLKDTRFTHTHTGHHDSGFQGTQGNLAIAEGLTDWEEVDKDETPF